MLHHRNTPSTERQAGAQGEEEGEGERQERLFNRDGLT